MAGKHDIRYKKLFSNPVLVRELLTDFVKEPWIRELDFETLERLNKSFITDEFKEKESDVIYRINFKGKDLYIYLLLEFQSRVDRFMALRMLRYMTEFYEYLVQSRHLKELPAVFPLMLYNGESKWTAPVSIEALIDKTIPGKYIPRFTYYKLAENEFSREILLGIKNIVSAIFYIENTAQGDLAHEIEKVVTLIKKEKPEQVNLFLRWTINYLQGKPVTIPDKIYDIHEVKTMLAATLKNRDKEFLEKGIAKGKIETAKKMHKEGLSMDMIIKCTGLSLEDIHAILKKKK